MLQKTHSVAGFVAAEIVLIYREMSIDTGSMSENIFRWLLIAASLWIPVWRFILN